MGKFRPETELGGKRVLWGRGCSSLCDFTLSCLGKEAESQPARSP